MLKTFFKSLLCSAPIAIIIAFMQSYDMALKLKSYPAYRYESIYDLDFICQLILFGISIIFVSIPVFLALKSNSKHKAWIIILDMLCFIPLGVVLYLVSLIWSVCAIVKYNAKKHEITPIKSEIVNNKNFLNLKKPERVKYLQSLKEQTVAELTKQCKEIEKEQNKLNDMPADVAKYVKHESAIKLKHDISKLENKIIAIDELVKSETENPKKRVSNWANYIDDDL